MGFTRPVTRPEYQAAPSAGRWTGMTSGGVLEPRDRVAAGRTLVVVAIVGAAVLVGYQAVGLAIGLDGPTVRGLGEATIIGAALLAVAGVAGAVPERMPGWSWTVAAFVGVLLVLWLGLATHDATAAGQIGFFYPVIYAAANLRPVPAWAASILAVMGDLALAFRELPVREAVPAVLVVGAGVFVVTAALQMLAHHQDELTARLSEIAAVDQLTGLASRRRLEEVALEVLATPCPPGDFRLGTGLAIVDVDHFKTINDSYGHPVGDAALVHVASLLRTTTPSRATVGRLGGDELAVLLPCCPAEELAEVMERFHDAIRTSPMNHLGRVIALSVSVGAAHVPGTRAAGLPELYAQADEALYQAKLRGRGRVVVA